MRYKRVRKREAETYGISDGEKTVFLATGADTDGRVSIYDSDLPEGKGAPWHYHEIDDEIFYLLSGKIEFGVNDETIIAEAGDLVIVGPLVHRRFVALADTRLVVINAPGGPSEGFLREVSNLGTPTKEDKKRFIDLYKIHLIDDKEAAS